MPVRIANWNLDRAKQLWRRESIRERMADVDAHVWVLTESRDCVTPGPGYRRIAHSTAHARGDNDERWVSIWTIFPNAVLRRTRDEEYSACAIVALSSDVALAVYGTVLPWRGSVWRGHASANATAYQAALSAQAEDWRELRDMPEVRGICVAGDFNQDLSDTPYYWSNTARHLLQRTLDDCGLAATTSEPTDPVRAVTNGAKACIDHICLSQRAMTSQVGTSHAWAPTNDGRTLSDHPGVWIELDF